jgi:hypothetical protein
MPGWKSKLVLVAATLGIASWVGYRAERRSMDAAGKPATTFRSVVRHVMAPKSRKESFDRLNRLRHAAGRSEPTPRELQQCWEIIRGFTVEDVQAYFAEIPDGLRRPVNGSLATMLFFRWAQMDPEAAMNAARQPPYAEDRMAQVVVSGAWVERDMEGAMRWVKTNGSDFNKMVIGSGAGRMMAIQDPENALARATAESPSTLQGALLTLTEQLSSSKESRQKLFELLAGMEDSKLKRLSLNQLMWYYADGDRDAALAAVGELEESGLLPEQLETFRKDVLRTVMYDRPKEQLEWLTRPGANIEGMTQLDAYASWVSRQPNEAIEWATQNGKVDFISDIVKRQTYESVRGGWQPGDSLRGQWENTLRVQIDTWKQHQPEAADAWLQSLPGDIRGHLTTAQAPAPAHDNGTH